MANGLPAISQARRSVALALTALATVLVPFGVPAAQGATPDVSSSPPDKTSYSRPAVAQDVPVKPFITISPDFFIKDTAAPGVAGNGEPSIAVNPNNPQQIVVTSFTSAWSGGNAVLFYSQDGGATWARDATVPVPPGIAAAFTNNCPCDQSVDYGRDNRLYGTFLLDDFGSPAKSNVVTGSTTDPSSAAAWSWNGNPAQLTNAAHLNNVDQPWLLVNRDPTTASQNDVYAAYDDFNGSPDARVGVSYGANPVNITADNKAGTESPLTTNPGLRLAADPRNGTMYVVYEQSSGSTQPKNVTYKLNRSTDGGATWTLNGSSDGLTVDSVKSDQAPGFKFGGVNALLGGVDHAAVDPTNGDVYVVYGVDNGSGGNNLQVRRMTDNGSGGLNVGGAQAVTSATANAALPSIAIASDRTIGVLYTTFDGTSGGFPQFSAHLARSTNQGASFNDEVLLTFLSPATDNTNDPRQRVLGDYQEMKAVGPTFFGAFSGNRVAATGGTTSEIDAIFFRTLIPTTLAIDGATTSDFHDAATVSATLRNAETNGAISGQSVKFVLNGIETCTGTTDLSGKASCPITPGEAAGTYTLTATFASTVQFQGFTTSTNFVVTKEETTLTYTGDTVIANGLSAHLSAVLKEDGTVPIAGRSVSLTLGSGATAQSCSPVPVTDAGGVASCTIATVAQPLGPGTVSASFAGDTFYLPSSDSKSTTIFAFPARGAFVIGDKNAAKGTAVTFWGANWSTLNSLTGGAAPDSFKGFANTFNSTPPTCGGTWTTGPGNSAAPPDVVPSFMGTIVSSSISKSGDTISGNISQIVVVTTNPGYQANPGHPGTGTVVTKAC